MSASLRTLFPLRTASQICSRCLSTTSRRAFWNGETAQVARSSVIPRQLAQSSSQTVPRRHFSSTPRAFASSPTVSEAMERIEELYENATEEFQIAAEETEGNTVYASDDRDAAKEEVRKLEEFYKSVVEGTGYDQDVREAVKRRAGQRVRELVNAMTALEEKAMEHD